MRAAFRQNVRCDDLIHNLTGRDGMPQSWDAIMTAARRYARTEKTLGKELALTDARNDINRACQGKKITSVWSWINQDASVKIQDPRGTQKQAKGITILQYVDVIDQETHTNHVYGRYRVQETPAIQTRAQRTYNTVLWLSWAVWSHEKPVFKLIRCHRRVCQEWKVGAPDKKYPWSWKTAFK